MYRLTIGSLLFLGIIFCTFSDVNKTVGKEKESLKIILDLTPQQEEEFIKLKKISFSDDSVYFAKLEKLRKQLLDESAKENINTKKINEIASQIGEIHLALSLHVSASIQETKKILTSTQFEKFIEYRKNKTHKESSRKKE